MQIVPGTTYHLRYNDKDLFRTVINADEKTVEYRRQEVGDLCKMNKDDFIKFYKQWGVKEEAICQTT